jgi:hypothetical protein
MSPGRGEGSGRGFCVSGPVRAAGARTQSRNDADPERRTRRVRVDDHASPRKPAVTLPDGRYRHPRFRADATDVVDGDDASVACMGPVALDVGERRSIRMIAVDMADIDRPAVQDLEDPGERRRVL